MSFFFRFFKVNLGFNLEDVEYILKSEKETLIFSFSDGSSQVSLIKLGWINDFC